MSKKLTLSVCLFVALLGMATVSVTAQAPPAANAPKPEPPDAAVPKGMKTLLLEVKHRDPRMLANVLNGLRSGAPYSQVSPNSELKVLTIRDFPENIATMQEAAKRLDLPEASPVNFDVQLHLIATSQTPTEAGSFPATLEPVVKQLQGTLKFAGYRYITSFTSRVKDNGKIESSGVADSIGISLNNKNLPPSFYQFTAGINATVDAAGKSTAQFREFRFGFSVPVMTSGTKEGINQVQYRDVGINSQLDVREGETIVVGTTNVGENAVIVVVSVKKV